MRCTKFYFQPEVVRNQNLQLLCYVIFFDILHHYGVIAASQICSVSRKYCAVLWNRFFFFSFGGIFSQGGFFSTGLFSWGIISSGGFFPITGTRGWSGGQPPVELLL